MSRSLGTSEWTVKVDGESTTAVFEPAEVPMADLVFVCAHGAGGNLADRSMIALARALVGAGVPVVRFNFLYREKKSGRPDPMPKLQACFAEVVARARRELSPARLFLGGRSMGGRAATMMAADGFDCAGLILFAYPLHPAGRPEKLRDAHLGRITVPVLSFNGTRDALCTRDLMERTIRPLPSWTQHWLEKADHGFHVLKSSGRSEAEVLLEAMQAVRAWLIARATSSR